MTQLTLTLKLMILRLLKSSVPKKIEPIWFSSTLANKKSCDVLTLEKLLHILGVAKDKPVALRKPFGGHFVKSTFITCALILAFQRAKKAEYK